MAAIDTESLLMVAKVVRMFLGRLVKTTENVPKGAGVLVVIQLLVFRFNRTHP